MLDGIYRPKKSKPKRLKMPKMPDASYRQIWRVVDGAVKTAFDDHPSYLRDPTHARMVRMSITKRVAGAIHGYARESFRRESAPGADQLPADISKKP